MGSILQWEISDEGPKTPSLMCLRANARAAFKLTAGRAQILYRLSFLQPLRCQAIEDLRRLADSKGVPYVCLLILFPGFVAI
jgi:hypothetical protein